jgi:hypothetical protein
MMLTGDMLSESQGSGNLGIQVQEGVQAAAIVPSPSERREKSRAADFAALTELRIVYFPREKHTWPLVLLIHTIHTIHTNPILSFGRRP